MADEAGLILDILGLLQLEISGVFKGIYDFKAHADERGGPLPSRYVREIIESPDVPEWRHRLRY